MYVQKMTKQVTAVAANRPSTQSHMSQPQKLLHKVCRDTGAEQHAQNHPIQEVLNLAHALVTITQRAVNTVVPLRADSFVNRQFSLH